ncbi:hypothetical protein ES703_93485 [subsurface metagenome]
MFESDIFSQHHNFPLMYNSSLSRCQEIIAIHFVCSTDLCIVFGRLSAILWDIRAKSLLCYSAEDDESGCVSDSDSGCTSSDPDSVVAGPVSTSSKCV